MAQINKPNTYFNPVLYTGNGINPRSVTGVGYQPDLIWVKERSSISGHQLIDSIRGAYHRLQTDNTNQQSNDVSPYNDFQSIDSDGWTVGAGGGVNENSQTYVGWNWLASGTAVSNTDGSITSSVSANTTSGFSIVNFVGTGSVATVGHGLSVAPAMIIVKRYDGGDGGQWNVYHKSLGASDYLLLNSTNATSSSATRWNNTAPTSSVFTVSTSGDVNNPSNNHIAYCFAEKKGFSKIGSYLGNGNADGTFIYTGFKPAFVIMKNTVDAGASWQMFDNKRNAYNQMNARLFPNLTNAESTDSANNIDFLSNGFKMRTFNGDTNSSGVTFIYMAFAENPLVGTNNIPATAR